MKIPFYKPYFTGKELEYIRKILLNGKDIGGDGPYTKRVHKFLKSRYHVRNVLLTTSCTTALEMAAQLLDLRDGDEVIMPSFTFSSTANAILLHKGKVVFAEIDPKTLNIDPSDIERKITKKTKAIVVVHYAGIACDMGAIMKIAKKHKLKVIEDAAQGIEAKWKNKYLGTIGDFGCISFHETKNITSGEGGALFINTDDKAIIEKAEIIREKGTNRSKFFRGEIDKYTWVEVGSSYLPSDILAAFLLAQLEKVKKITDERRSIYSYYHKELAHLEKQSLIQLPFIPPYATHSAHIFYVLFRTKDERDMAMSSLQKNGVGAVFHYIPLHSAPQGMKLGYKKADFPLTERVSGRILRLPIYSGMSKRESQFVMAELKKILKVLKVAPDKPWYQ